MKKPLLPIRVLQGAFEPWPSEGEIHDLIVRGAIPNDLRGTFFRNGPNPQFVLNERHHIFDGDGMVHAFEFSDKTVRYYSFREKYFGVKSAPIKPLPFSYRTQKL